MSTGNDHEACACVTVAQNDVGAVSACPQCGVVTMRLQYISLRFEMEAFDRVALLVQRAQARLSGAPSIAALYREAGDAAAPYDEPAHKPH